MTGHWVYKSRHIVVGLCFELLSRLSHYIHPSRLQKNLNTWQELNPWPLSLESSAVTTKPGLFVDVNYYIMFRNSLIVFLRLTIRLQQFIQFQTCHGCINHDIVKGLCSKLLIRLSYYIHPSRIRRQVFNSRGNQTRDLLIMSSLA